jgi:hypothetical protein
MRGMQRDSAVELRRGLTLFLCSTGAVERRGETKCTLDNERCAHLEHLECRLQHSNLHASMLHGRRRPAD